MSATTPLWLPLVLGVGGLVTTLGAAVMAGRWAARREDVRWQRERSDRQEQWRREDSLRWLQDRKQAYARLIRTLDEWDAETKMALGFSVNLKTKKVFAKAEIDRLSKAAAEAMTQVEFMAPELICMHAKRAVAFRSALWLALFWELHDDVAHVLPFGPSPVRERLAETRDNLFKIMQKHLGLKTSGDEGQPGLLPSL
jgi:hypothetical protein